MVEVSLISLQGVTFNILTGKVNVCNGIHIQTQRGNGCRMFVPLKRYMNRNNLLCDNTLMWKPSALNALNDLKLI